MKKDDDCWVFLEYGICGLQDFPHELPKMTTREANKFIKNFWKSQKSNPGFLPGYVLVFKNFR